jgi:hypothetical protein
MLGITSSNALMATSYVCFAFSIGMCFFPAAMMEGYQADTFEGTARTFFQFSMGIFGIQQMWTSIACRSNARGNNKAVQSVACFCAALTWFFFAASDGSLVYLKTLPPCIPEEAIMGNCVLFVILALVSIVGWVDGGSVLPNFGAILAPKGDAKLPILLMLGNLLPFGIGCAFFTGQFVEMFAPGVMGAMPNNEVTSAMVLLIMSNAGKIMLINSFSTLAVLSVGDGLDSYRLLRCICFVNMFYIGGLSRENVLATATGWDFPMYVPTCISCIGVTFFGCSAVSAIPVTLVVDAKKAK